MTGNDQRSLRIKILAVLLFSVIVIYGFKLFSMQILQGDVYRKQSQTISQRSKKISAQRGEIFDRNGTVPMVLNIDSFAVDVIPGEIPSEQFSTVVSRLAGFLDMTVTAIERKIPASIRRSFQTVELKANIPYSVITNIAENIDELPGVSWHSKPIRSYVETGSFSHILGYVGDITREELKLFYNKGYTTNSIIGKAGIEKQYDETLRGVDGFEYRTVDVKGRYIENSVSIMPPEMGKNLVLTIDRKIQILAEDALGARIGSAIVLKPATGEILGMVSYPYFDPNLFGQENFAEEYQRLLNDKDNPLLNRVVNASYPPASTFKIIMSTALIEENAIPLDRKIDCPGQIEYGDRIFRCHIRRPGHGPLDMKHALAQSCDIYYWVTGRDNLGVERIASYAREFGFGQSAEIDLPSQTAGFVPTPQWKERRFHEKWLGGDTMNMSIGQGYMLASPLQVANSVAMIVNGGTIYRPYLLKEVRDPVSNAVISVTKKEALFTSRISPDSFARVREDMRFVITDGSSQFPMRNRRVAIAGKTGTAEVGYADRWHSWMAAYGPYDAPVEDMIVVVVMVEASNPWEWWAPYATNIIFQGIFADQTYEEAVAELGLNQIATPRGRQE
ncbi:penicillin-binding protein 2 [Brucepastera parasyntrophica]|uniref:penicillin-binding protein 2 n=1 Tax=Brucepastera parasyntrophica TaxID=2880008 RepID=UPI00210EAC7C|nr:penicillin-binding protein 2 [Brucepastera parasyntrophica]ULQ59991.1 penicillin-binding protein 2 [Brucepastera parasyntrophica]